MDAWVWMLIGFGAGLVVAAIIRLIFRKDHTADLKQEAEEREAELSKAEMKAAVLQDKLLDAESALEEQQAKSEAECQVKLDAAETAYLEKVAVLDKQFANLETAFAAQLAAKEEEGTQAAGIAAAMVAAGVIDEHAATAKPDEYVDGVPFDADFDADELLQEMAEPDEDDLVEAALVATGAGAALAGDDVGEETVEAAAVEIEETAGQEDSVEDLVDDEETADAEDDGDDKGHNAAAKVAMAAAGVGVAAAVLGDDEDDEDEAEEAVEVEETIEESIEAAEEIEESADETADSADGVVAAAAVWGDDEEAEEALEVEEAADEAAEAAAEVEEADEEVADVADDAVEDGDDEGLSAAAKVAMAAAGVGAAAAILGNDEDDDEEEAEDDVQGAAEDAAALDEPAEELPEAPQDVDTGEEDDEEEDGKLGAAALAGGAAAAAIAASGEDDEEAQDDMGMITDEEAEETAVSDADEDTGAEPEMAEELPVAAAAAAVLGDGAEDETDAEAGEEQEEVEPEEPPWPEDTSIWHGEYFNNVKLEGDPVLVRDDAEIDFDWGFKSPAPEINVDGFSARWTRTADLPPGLYRFTVTSDDGARLWVNERLVISAWYDHTEMTFRREMELPGGPVDLKLEYYENAMEALIRVSWERIG